jgi:putative VirB-like lipoprotein
MRKLLYIFFALVLLASCNSPRRIGSTVVDSIVTERETTSEDTTLGVAADSSLYQALIECDSNGRAHLSELNALKLGLRSRLTGVALTPIPSRPAVNLLTFDCVCDSMAIYFAMAKVTETIKETKSKVETITVEVNKLNWWQQSQIYGFRGLASLLLIIILIKYLTSWLPKIPRR